MGHLSSNLNVICMQVGFLESIKKAIVIQLVCIPNFINCNGIIWKVYKSLFVQQFVSLFWEKKFIFMPICFILFSL